MINFISFHRLQVRKFLPAGWLISLPSHSAADNHSLTCAHLSLTRWPSAERETARPGATPFRPVEIATARCLGDYLGTYELPTS